MYTSITSMRELIVHTFRVVFFLENQERVSRGEYRIGFLISLLTISLLPVICLLVVFGLYQCWWMLVWEYPLLSETLYLITILFCIRVLPISTFIILLGHLSLKRSYDLGHSRKRLLWLLIPLLNLYIVIQLFFTPWNKDHYNLSNHASNKIYWIVCISIFGFISLLYYLVFWLRIFAF